MSVGLGLSILATVISLSSLTLHFVRFRREKPDLQIEVMKCRHHALSAKVKQTQLRIEFYVHNKGDRATQLNRLELETFGQTNYLQNAVDAHRSIKEDCNFDIPVNITDEILQCTFVLHHTHGDKKFDITSQKSAKSLG